MELKISEDHALRYTILAFLNEIVNEYSKSLNNWRNVAELKKTSNDETPYSNAVRILINSQRDTQEFFKLFSEHIKWLAKSINFDFFNPLETYLDQLFSKIRVDIEEIHRRICDITDQDLKDDTL